MRDSVNMFRSLASSNFCFFKQARHARTLFTVSLTYRVPLEEVEKHLEEHRVFLKDHYEKGVLIASGAKVPRTGGVMIASSADREILESVLRKDPFYYHKIADYEITEFTPTMYSKEFENIAINDHSYVR